MSEENKDNKESGKLVKQVTGAVGTAKDVITHGLINGQFFSIDKFKERIAICQACPFYDAEKIRCKDCGCFLKVKASFIAAKCPQNKW